MFYFPQASVGKREEASRTNQSCRQKKIDAKHHEAMGELLDTLGWVIKGGGTSDVKVDVT